MSGVQSCTAAQRIQSFIELSAGLSREPGRRIPVSDTAGLGTDCQFADPTAVREFVTVQS